ncbi:ankyrin repeat domain-containing protein [Lederbergia sp. NSJ-179]|uniref:ankyrin repeat domain-containing protein n=1 Tax=Lederbergia sp. NSJ-179 TaxID=2931402 RepID=UPI001FD0E0D4|nr:ankyrin repeat domain-containing protein [Lederbergia sp. NSJ-179]MCJ7841969.1 ankyrin repeat domain-containing protein [Lederbergia sp. NSJ-179]
MNKKKKNPRNVVISVRLDESSLMAVDLLVNSGLSQSRSEAASQFISIGIQSSENLLIRAKNLAENVKSLKDEMVDAVKAKNLDKVKQILNQDANLVNAKNIEGETAVLMSAYFHANEIKELLLERGAELDIYEASAVGATDRVKEILRHSPELLNSHNKDGYTLLGLSSYFGNEKTVEYLLKTGADVNLFGKDGKVSNTALHAAIAANHEKIVKMLLDNGANANAKCRGNIRSGFTPLHVAVYFNRMSMIKILLDHGADKEICNDNDQTPAYYARQIGNDELAEMIMHYKSMK